MSAAGWAEDAHRRLADAGHRAGGARATVIAELAACGGCCSAQELADRLREQGRTVGTASVYRALNALVEVRALRGTDVGEGVVRYELVLPHGDHHHHLVCDRCGRTEAFEDPELEAAIERVAHASPFRVEDHDIVLRGRCPRCVTPPNR
jgi:Fur family ferric uptake transcriptional regulator